jgi:DNA repair exonuclease SbcCD ATPase subunit
VGTVAESHEGGVEVMDPDVIPLPGLYHLPGAVGQNPTAILAAKQVGRVDSKQQERKAIDGVVAQMLQTMAHKTGKEIFRKQNLREGKDETASPVDVKRTVGKLVKCFLDATPKCLNGGTTTEEKTTVEKVHAAATEERDNQQILELKKSLLDTEEAKNKMQAKLDDSTARAEKAEKNAQDEMDTAQSMIQASKKLAGLPAKLDTVEAEAAKSKSTAAELKDRLEKTVDEKNKIHVVAQEEQRDSEKKIADLTADLEQSRVQCRTSLARAQTNAANAMEAISAAEQHAQGLSAQIDELKMEQVASQNTIESLESKKEGCRRRNTEKRRSFRQCCKGQSQGTVAKTRGPACRQTTRS